MLFSLGNEPDDNQASPLGNYPNDHRIYSNSTSSMSSYGSPPNNCSKQFNMYSSVYVGNGNNPTSVHVNGNSYFEPSDCQDHLSQTSCDLPSGLTSTFPEYLPVYGAIYNPGFPRSPPETARTGFDPIPSYSGVAYQHPSDLSPCHASYFHRGDQTFLPHNYPMSPAGGIPTGFTANMPQFPQPHESRIGVFGATIQPIDLLYLHGCSFFSRG
jgi:hypothetical protein